MLLIAFGGVGIAMVAASAPWEISFSAFLFSGLLVALPYIARKFLRQAVSSSKCMATTYLVTSVACLLVGLYCFSLFLRSNLIVAFWSVWLSIYGCAVCMTISLALYSKKRAMNSKRDDP